MKLGVLHPDDKAHEDNMTSCTAHFFFPQQQLITAYGQSPSKQLQVMTGDATLCQYCWPYRVYHNFDF